MATLNEQPYGSDRKQTWDVPHEGGMAGRTCKPCRSHTASPAGTSEPWHDHFPSACCSIQARMSSALHAVTRTESFTGSGKDLARIRRQSVDLETGMNKRTWDCRRKPVWGKVGGETAAPEHVGKTAQEGFVVGMRGLVTACAA